MSEVEKDPAWLEYSSGIWLDAFESEWYDTDTIAGQLSSGKRVCLVSPELHGRAHQTLWQRIADLKDQPNLMICTDYPVEARDYFRIE
jgi:hypothetical protein